MGATARSVHQWSSHVGRRSVQIADLDLYVLQAHPHILHALGREPVRASARWPEASLLAGTVAAGLAVLILAPAWWRQDYSRPWLDPADLGSRAEPAAAVLFLVAIGGCLAGARMWWRSGRRRHDVEVIGLAVTVVAAAVALWLMSRTPVAYLVGGVSAAVPAALTVLAATVVLVHVALCSTGSRDETSRDFRVVGPADQEAARALIGELPPTQQAWLRTERHRALERLRSRRVIDAGQAVRVTELGLGGSVLLDA